MREFIRDFWFDEGLLGKILISGLFIMVVLCAAVVIVIIDNVTGYTEPQKVSISGHRFSRAHCTTSTVIVGKTTQVNTVCHPDRWYVEVSYLSETYDCLVSEKVHDSSDEGSITFADMTRGGLFGGSYCEGLTYNSETMR